MPLHPSYPSPERILAIGPAGSGKTTNWLDIARWHARTKSPAKFHVGDTDFAVDRMLSGYPEVIPSINLTNLYDWPDYVSFMKTVTTQATPDDWVIVDFIGSAWQAVQQHYTEQVFHKEMGDYFLQARKELDKKASSLNALEGWTDWSVINALYRQWVNPLLFRGRYHVYATAKSDQLSSDKKPTEDAQTRSLFLPYGIKPAGQKDLPYQFHTLLITGRDGRGTRTLTTVKDREREEVKGLEVKSFTVDYLKKIAGWEMA
jgi:AAA domain-containing protein